MSSKQKSATKNAVAWEAIFQALPIEESVQKNGFFDITADQIKEYGSKREPRLMTKIDFREHLPPVMSSRQLSILAIENGVYRIGKFDPFISISPLPQAKPRHVSFPQNIITLRQEAIKTESAALDAALAAGVLDEVFGEAVKLTIRGRTRSPGFDFNLGETKFSVSGVQNDPAFQSIEEQEHITNIAIRV